VGQKRAAHNDVSTYLAWQLNQDAGSEITVRHVEMVKSENVMGTLYEVWDCATTDGRWWVATPPSNLYSQTDFQSADVVMTFHIGLAARLMSRREIPIGDEGESMFPDVWRKWADAENGMRDAIEAADFQAVGMRLRETIVAFMKASAHESLVPAGTDAPQGANLEWLNLVSEKIAAGPSNARLRSYLKALAKETWQYVSWLTHAARAQREDAEIALVATSHLIAVFTAGMLRFARGEPTRCPLCGSYLVLAGRCWKCDWVDSDYSAPEAERVSEEELARRLLEPHTPSSDISTFLSPDNLRWHG
jgi:hypothetical protein